MLFDTWRYYISFLQVLAACAFLFVILPLVIWRRYLRGRSRAFSFTFCVLTQNAFLVNLVLLLGLLKQLNRVNMALCVVTYSLLVEYSFSSRHFMGRLLSRLMLLSRVLQGTARLSVLLLSLREARDTRLARLRSMGFLAHVQANALEYLLLGAALLYNVWFMARGALTYHSVQFSDITVHQSWIWGMNQGTLFVSGIYPFAMHANIYVVHNLFFLDLREVLLYFGAFQTGLLFLMTYLLAREIFRVKWSALGVSIVFSFLLTQGRFAASLPQECGMFAVSAAILCLIRFLRTPLKRRTIPGDGRLRRLLRLNQYLVHRYLTTDALLFGLAVSLCIAYHFYTAIAAALFVFAVLGAHLPLALAKRYWVPVVTAGALGVVLAVAPFAASYARGTPFQESMQWALTVMSGGEWKGSDANYLQQFEESLGVETAPEATPVPQEAPSLQQEAGLTSPGQLPDRVYRAMVDFSISTMYGQQITRLLFLCLGLGALGGLFHLPSRRLRNYGYACLSIVAYTAIMMVMGAAQTLGIPEIFAAARATSFLQPFLGLTFAIPLDMVAGFLGDSRKAAIRRGVLALHAGVLALCVALILGGGYGRKFFDVNLAYYNEADYLTNRIRESFPRYGFTIVSPTEEYYQTVDYGYHEELSYFMHMINQKNPDYRIPTPEVFIFIEKKVLSDYYHGSPLVSRELAERDFLFMGSNQDYYFQRAVLQSQAWYWAQAFGRMYPDDFTVYFENDIYVCYRLTQNPYFLYNYNIDYLS